MAYGDWTWCFFRHVSFIRKKPFMPKSCDNPPLPHKKTTYASKTLNLTVISGFSNSPHPHRWSGEITPGVVTPGGANRRYVRYVEIAMKAMMVWGSKSFTLSCKLWVNVAKQGWRIKLSYCFRCSADKWWNRIPIKQVVKQLHPGTAQTELYGGAQSNHVSLMMGALTTPSALANITSFFGVL